MFSFQQTVEIKIRPAEYRDQIRCMSTETKDIFQIEDVNSVYFLHFYLNDLHNLGDVTNTDVHPLFAFYLLGNVQVAAIWKSHFVQQREIIGNDVEMVPHIIVPELLSAGML